MAKMFGSKITRRRTPWLSLIVCSFFLCNCLSFNDKYHHLYLFSNEPYATHTTTERPASQKSLFCSSLYVRAHFCYVLFVLLSFPVCVCVCMLWLCPSPPVTFMTLTHTNAHPRSNERTTRNKATLSSSLSSFYMHIKINIYDMQRDIKPFPHFISNKNQTKQNTIRFSRRMRLFWLP